MDNDDFYLKLRKKIRDWLKTDDGKTNKFAEYLMFSPDLFHLLCKLSIDKDVEAIEKAKLVAAIAYFISAVDLMPEALVGPSGDADVLNVIKQILNIADAMLGSGLWENLKKTFDKKVK